MNMTATDVLKKLEKLGSPSIKKTLLRHGAREPFFGVKIGDLKVLQKQIKVNTPLAKELFATGISDAMYLAGLVTDPAEMSRKELERWMEQAPWHMISSCTVAWVAAESAHGLELGFKWIDSKNEQTAAAGWATLASVCMIRKDEDLPIKDYEGLLKRIEKEVHASPNEVRNAMNQFIIACGASISALTERALAAAKKIGPIQVDVGDTACEVPDPVSYIEKIRKMGRIGKKKKHARC